MDWLKKNWKKLAGAVGVCVIALLGLFKCISAEQAKTAGELLNKVTAESNSPVEANAPANAPE